jgi:drug/metabolite transporter (DMT)-like permease
MIASILLAVLASAGAAYSLADALPLTRGAQGRQWRWPRLFRSQLVLVCIAGYAWVKAIQGGGASPLVYVVLYVLTILFTAAAWAKRSKWKDGARAG